MAAVENHASANLWIFSGSVKRQGPTHTKTNSAHFVASSGVMIKQILNCPAQIFLGFINAHGHHQFSCLVGRLRHFAMEKIGCERHETLCGKAITNILDVIDKTPPFLNDYDTRPVATFRDRQVSGSLSAITLEFHHCAHGSSPTPPRQATCSDSIQRHPNDSSRQGVYQTDR